MRGLMFRKRLWIIDLKGVSDDEGNDKNIEVH